MTPEQAFSDLPKYNGLEPIVAVHETAMQTLIVRVQYGLWIATMSYDGATKDGPVTDAMRKDILSLAEQVAGLESRVAV